MVNNTLVSVIICTKNRPQLLLQSIDSVLVQTYMQWELIIVDDGSDEPVELLVDEHLTGLNVPYSCLRNERSQGIANTRNMGVEKSVGSYIYFLDDDDLLIDSALEELMQIIKEYSLDCVFHNFEPFGIEAKEKSDKLFEANSRVLSIVTYTQPKDNIYIFNSDLYKGLLVTVPVSFQHCLMTRNLWDMSGGMRSEAEMPEPEWAVKVALFGKCSLIIKPMCLWRVDGQNFYSLKVDEYKIQNRVIDNMLSLVTFSQESNFFDQKVRVLIKRSLGDAYFNLAWGYLEGNQRIQAAFALIKSAYIYIGIKHIKLSVKLFLPRL